MKHLLPEHVINLFEIGTVIYDLTNFFIRDLQYLVTSILQNVVMEIYAVQEWGLDLAKESTLNSATVKYTDFLLATASGKVEGVKGPGLLATPFEKTKVAAYTLGAMTPCMRLYAFLGKELLTCCDSTDETISHPYKKWIDSYASDSFEVNLLHFH